MLQPEAWFLPRPGCFKLAGLRFPVPHRDIQVRNCNSTRRVCENPKKTDETLAQIGVHRCFLLSS
jgi:hypothetical protein